MLQVLFSYPLPNNGDRYDLSKEELRELLQKAYDSGFKVGKSNEGITTTYATE